MHQRTESQLQSVRLDRPRASADARPESSYPPFAPPRTDRDRPTTVVVEPGPARRYRDPTHVDHRERTVRTNRRRHAARATTRVSILIGADVSAALAAQWAYMTLFAGSALDLGLLRAGWAALPLSASLPLALAVTGNYGAGDRRREVGRLMLGAAIAVMLPLWEPLGRLPLGPVVPGFFASVLFLGLVLVALRLAIDVLVQRYRPVSRSTTRTLLVGTRAACADAVSHANLVEESGFVVVGFADTEETPGTDAVGRLDDLVQILDDHRIETIVLCGRVPEGTFTRMIRAATAAECEVFEAQRLFGYAGVRPQVIWRRGRPMIELRALAVRGPNLIMKRIFDVVLSSLALIVASPLMLALAIVVRIDSRGPAVFGHPRIGRHGRLFRCLKFRSMCTNATEMLRNDPVLYELYLKNDCKLPEDIDPRVTRVGRLLRRTSLDELPQLWNVLKGDMSLVGPRPIVPEELEHFSGEEPLLLSLRPGVTGLWQVQGRSTVKYPARALLELHYVQTWSVANDLRILLQTIPAVFAQRGAH